jgi:hypothetical protein
VPRDPRSYIAVTPALVPGSVHAMWLPGRPAMQATAISARKVDFSRASRQPLATASAWMRACRPTPPTHPDWTMSGCNGRYAGRCRNGARSGAGGQVTERTRRTQPPEYHRRTELFSGVLRAPSARRSPDQRRSENPRTRLPGGLRFGTRFEAGWRRPLNRSLGAMASVNLRSCRHGQASGARFVACWILGVRFAGHRRSSGP